MPPKRITETWRVGHEHRESVAGYRNRADRYRSIAWASLLFSCGGGFRETRDGRVDIRSRGVSDRVTGDGKEIWLPVQIAKARASL